MLRSRITGVRERGIEGLRARGRRRFQGMLRRAQVGPDGGARIAARQIYILPTRAGILYATVVFGMLLGSLNYQNNLGLLFAFFLVGVGLVAMHYCWFNLLGLNIQARAGEAVFAGEDARFEVILENRRNAPRYDLHICTGLDRAGPCALEPMGQHALAVSLETERRGLLPLREVEIRTRHPMGLFEAWCYASCGASVLVYPHPADRAPTPRVSAGESRGAAPAGGEGADDYLGPREYRPGDSPRRLDWKAFARERGLVTKQFGGDEGVDLWVDWDQMQVDDRESRIALLTRQVVDAAAGRLRFGLRIPGMEIGLDRGPSHLQHCLTALALFDHVQSKTDPPRRAA